MEFHEKLQELRKQSDLTQEELAQKLFVSRTAVSKWESGRGYPNIDSLKGLAACFSVTVDDLLSGDQLLTIAQEDTRQKADHLCDLVYGLLDLSVVILLFLPLFGQTVGGQIFEVSLLSLTEPQAWLRVGYFVIVGILVLSGLLTLCLQNTNAPFWSKYKYTLSLLMSAVGVVVFMVSLQPYAAVYLFICLMIQAVLRIKWQ